jgi:hypothetical protein
MDKYQSPFRYPDEHMRLLGIIAAHWEAVEVVVDVILAKTMRHEHGRVGLLTSHISFANKMDLLTIFVRDAYGLESENPTWKEFNKTKERMSKAYGLRNKYVHGQWDLNPETGGLARRDIRIKGGKLDLGDEEATEEKMAAAAQEITDAGEQFVVLFDRLGIRPEKSA